MQVRIVDDNFSKQIMFLIPNSFIIKIDDIHFVEGDIVQGNFVEQ